MTAVSNWLWSIVSWLSLPVMAVVAGILVSRKLHRIFPLFFSFLVVATLIGILRLVVNLAGTSKMYFYTYWISDLVLMVCTFLAVYELFVMRLFPGFYKVRFYRYLFAFAAVSIILLAWITAFVSPNRRAWVLVEARVLGFIVVAILIFLVSLMMLMGRMWTKYDFGIGFGFAFQNAAVLATSAAWVRSRFGPTRIHQLPLIAFDVSCLIWLYCFWSRDRILEQESKPVSITPAMVDQAQSWQTLLKGWLMTGKSKQKRVGEQE